MFLDKDKNRKMLEGSYKKIKSYYNYNKNFVFMKQKIAEYEFDASRMNYSLENLSEILMNLESETSKESIKKLIDKINFFIMPKAFADKSEKNQMFVSNNEPVNKPVNKVNFFIDMPIELHLLETLWTVLVGKIAYDKGIITDGCYGNCIDNKVVYNHEKEYLASINFDKNNLFKIYFYQYCDWKNNSIYAAEKNIKKDTALVSLDIKSYYYTVNFNFRELLVILQNDENLIEIEKLTNIIEQIYVKYTGILSEFREVLQDYKKQEVLLPIGTFSSMLIANLYLSEFDNSMKNNKKVLYYGRYVDDMLILLDVSADKKVDKNIIIDDYLVEKNKILDKVKENKYCIHKLDNLIIQKDKVKIIYLEAKKSRSIINQLKKTIKIPSQMNIIQDSDLELNDFEEAAYVISNFNNETKIRDIGQVEVDKFQLGWYLSQIVQNSKVNKALLTEDEKISRQHEGEKILEFFNLSKALEYSSNWINVMYFYLLTNEWSYFKKFETNVREAIKGIRTEHIEGLVKGKERTIKAKMKRCLEKHFDICVATVLAINPSFSKKEKDDIRNLSIELRKANLFNHYLVSFPLVNYVDDLDDNVDLTKLTLDDIHRFNLDIKENRKVKLSPRFIKLDELFQWVFLRNTIYGGNYYLDGKISAREKIEAIEQFFYKVNSINKSTVKPLSIEINNEKILDKYIVQKIRLGKEAIPKSKIRIAIANIKLDTKMCCYGLENKVMPTLKKRDFNLFLKTAYDDGKNRADFLLFPEFYLPVEWIAEVMSFVRKTGITVITGLHYMTYRNCAFNNIAVFAPVKTGRYQNSFLIVREKNDYAPMEQQILAIKNFVCKNQDIPNYQIITNDGIDYGTFLCYEFTDIVARSLYKNQIDLLFTPEHNRDTTYFSNIIETTTRDLHAFIVQANTSIYGDSRITGPYSRNDRNIVQIKGGDMDNIIIGTIDLKGVMDYQIGEQAFANSKIDEYLRLDKKKRYEKETKLYDENVVKVSKTSARFDSNRLKRKFGKN